MNFINNRKFVTTWMTCDTVSDVSRKMKLTNVQVSAKANNLRSKGVKLPAKQRGEVDDTIDDLNAIVNKYTKGVSHEQRPSKHRK